MRKSSERIEESNTYSRSQQPGKKGRLVTDIRTPRLQTAVKKKSRKTNLRGTGKLTRARTGIRAGSAHTHSSMKQETDNYSCTACSNFVAFDALVMLNGKPYHMDCFICSACFARLPISSKPTIKKGNLLCITCCKPVKKKKFMSPSKLFSASFSMSTRTLRSRTGSKARPSHKASRGLNSSFVCEDINDSWETSSNVTGYHLCFPETESTEEFDFALVKSKVRNIQKDYPRNLMAKSIDESFLSDLEQDFGNVRVRFFKCITAGIVSPHFAIGALAMSVEDYEDFKPFFHNLIKSASSLSKEAQLKADTEALRFRYRSAFQNEYDVADERREVEELIKGFELQFIRNFADYPMMGSMPVYTRYDLEQHLLPVLKQLMVSKYKGSVTSVEHESKEARQILENIEETLVFQKNKLSQVSEPLKSMDLMEYADFREKLNPFEVEKKRFKLGSKLHGTAIAKNFPHGSGVYVSGDSSFRIFYNHDDHLRFEFYDTYCGTDLNQLYEDFTEFLNTFEDIYAKVYRTEANYSISPEIGYLTSCPGKVGSGFMASVFLELPELAEEDSVRNISQKYKFLFKRKLSAKGSSDALYRISPIPRVFETEEMILRNLYKLVPKVLLEEENADAI